MLHVGLLITIVNKQVGCGAGNTIFPLVATFPDIFVYACDFSPRAVSLVKVCFSFLLLVSTLGFQFLTGQICLTSLNGSNMIHT